jgi:hypothetical protein
MALMCNPLGRPVLNSGDINELMMIMMYMRVCADLFIHKNIVQHCRDIQSGVQFKTGHQIHPSLSQNNSLSSNTQTFQQKCHFHCLALLSEI